MPVVHNLKCWLDPFQALIDGRKSYEVREDDRNYQVGDELVLHEWDPQLYESLNAASVRGYTGRQARVTVTHKTGPGEWGLPAKLCVLGITLRDDTVSVHEVIERILALDEKREAAFFESTRVLLARYVKLCDELSAKYAQTPTAPPAVDTDEAT